MIGSVILGIITSITIVTGAVVLFQNNYCNKNGIYISKAEYEHLQTLVYDNSEIEDLDIEKFQKLTSMEIINTRKEESALNFDTKVDIIGTNDTVTTNNSASTILESFDYTDDEILLQNGISQEEMNLLLES